MSHVYVGTRPETLGNGRILTPDEIVDDVDPSDPHDAYLIAEGRLIKQDITPQAKAAQTRARNKNEEG